MNLGKCNGRTARASGVLPFGASRGLTIPFLDSILPNNGISSGFSGLLDTVRGALNVGRNSNILGLVKQSSGLFNAGNRGGGNYGAGWGSNARIVGVPFGDNTDFNVNPSMGQFQGGRSFGIPGIFEESSRTNFDWQHLNFADQKRRCIFGFCADRGFGFGGI
ncbi:unnamed protein product [Soboliphyme baturini]|uniref:Uncharacterized protein n=1 Tax=Soboliphyme baturini TaxID=241478 RepID=A0A183J9N2_9BILA|nr:unnamed protein product [Soboliphyme baturini]